LRKQRYGEFRNWDSLYHKIGYCFRDRFLLKRALSHRSFCHEDDECVDSNERLEFLGDAVLGLVVTDELFRKFPDASEGELTRAKSILVSRERLAAQARAIGLGDFILLGGGEDRSGGRQRKSILADTYEALLGALYLDAGLEKVRVFIKKNLLRNVGSLVGDKFHNNFKSWLLEYIQAQGGKSPEYRVKDEQGPDHRKEFTVEVRVRNRVLGTGRGFSKKEAEQDAAKKAIESLGLR
jgi:ribonuclease-3